jgi:hypothetical protein
MYTGKLVCEWIWTRSLEAFEAMREELFWTNLQVEAETFNTTTAPSQLWSMCDPRCCDNIILGTPPGLHHVNTTDISRKIGHFEMLH